MQKGGSGSWAVSMWVWVSHIDSDSAPAPLIFKGAVQDQQRTPSLWLHPPHQPGSGYPVSLRFSTAAEVDVGLETAVRLPRRTWVHLTLSVFNHTACVAATQPTWCDTTRSYEVHVFTNGQFAASVYFPDKDPPLANTHPLHLGSMPGTPGVHCLMAGIHLHSEPISDKQAQWLFSASRESFLDPGHASGASERDLLGAVVGATQEWTSSTTTSSGMPLTESEAQDIFEEARSLRADCSHVNQMMVERAFSVACGDGWGLPDACVELAKLLLQPPRAQCKDETRRWAAFYARNDKSSSLLDSVSATVEAAAAPASPPQVPARDTARAKEVLGVTSTHHKHAEATYMLAMLWMTHAGSGAHPTAAAEAEAALVATGSQAQLQPGVGLLHIAGMLGWPRAWTALAALYDAPGVPWQDAEGAAFYLFLSSRVAKEAFHKRGQQPFHETALLNMDTVEWIEQGQHGEDDELIQYQLAQAEAGDATAALNMADLYYWGARGVQRDQAQAARFFDIAARAGNAQAMSALAGLYLKGEGVAQNHSQALQLYSAAANASNIRGLNGLGFMYYFGDGVEQNQTKAFHLFTRAADQRLDGDSIFNAATCHQQGTGTPVNQAAAAELMLVAARDFGHFDAITAIGEQHYTGQGHLARNVATATEFLRAAAGMGEWGGLPRAAFDRYLLRDYTGAAMLYLEAAHLGLQAGYGNAAYLFDRRLARLASHMGQPTDLQLLPSVPSSDHWDGLQAAFSRQLYERAHALGAVEVQLPLGTMHLFGRGGLPVDVSQAMQLFAGAAGRGNAQAAYNLGYLYEHGVPGVLRPDPLRAVLYYEQVLQVAPVTAGLAHAVPVYIALARLQARRAIESSPFLQTLASFVPGLHWWTPAGIHDTAAHSVAKVALKPKEHPANPKGNPWERQEEREAAAEPPPSYARVMHDLAHSWTASWIRSALALVPQEHVTADAQDSAESDQASIVSSLLHPRRSLLQLLAKHSIPTVYIHYLWVALLAAAGTLAILAATVVLVWCRRPPTNTVSDSTAEPGAIGDSPQPRRAVTGEASACLRTLALNEGRRLAQPDLQGDGAPQLANKGASPSLEQVTGVRGELSGVGEGLGDDSRSGSLSLEGGSSGAGVCTVLSSSGSSSDVSTESFDSDSD